MEIRSQSTIDFAVHPRTCGEHSPKHRTKPRPTGSSPHMRGTSLVRAAHPRVSRFIPAHAGNINCGSSAPSQPTVHPRTCGEHIKDEGTASLSFGSSPHMRGTFERHMSGDCHCRFIPAHAGNISRLCRQAGNGPVHPRTCGEHRNHPGQGLCVAGSSPHMRGTFQPVRQGVVSGRFIPAHAGNMIVGSVA